MLLYALAIFYFIGLSFVDWTIYLFIYLLPLVLVLTSSVFEEIFNWISYFLWSAIYMHDYFYLIFNESNYFFPSDYER